MKHIIRFLFPFLLILALVLPCSAESNLSALFQQALNNGESEDLAQDLSDACQEDPEGFSSLLAENDQSLQETVARMVNTHNRGNAEYIRLVLSQIPDTNNAQTWWILFHLLPSETVDLSNAPEDFAQTLFTALRYSDGALTTRCFFLMARLLETDPFGLVEKVALEDAEFQSFCIASLAYENYSWDGLTKDDPFHQSLAILMESNVLTEAEQAFVAQLADQITALEQDAEAARNATAPAGPSTEYTEATEPVPTQTLSVDTDEPNYGLAWIALICAAALVLVGMAWRKREENA